MYPKLQYISQGITANEHIKNIEDALACGCEWVQLRMKDFTTAEMETTARKVSTLCKDYNAIFIINDNPTLAKNVDADGVHLGLTDMPISEARAMLGKYKIIGGTANSLTEVQQRITEGCDYIGLGPLRFTQTKKNLSPIIGLEGYHNIIKKLTLQQLSTRIYAIGGIELIDIKELIKTGVYGIAVSSMITKGVDKKGLITNIKKLIDAI